jgi:hypothetical protein
LKILKYQNRRKEVWLSVLNESVQGVGQCRASSGKIMGKAITQRVVRLTAAKVVQRIPAAPALKQAGAADALHTRLNTVAILITFALIGVSPVQDRLRVQYAFSQFNIGGN